MGSISDGQSAELWSKAAGTFLPFTPIKLVELFQGRSNEIRRVVAAVELPGRHVVLFGDRGLGKTSLANLIPFFANWTDDRIYTYSCSSTDTFATIFDSIFSITDDGLQIKELTSNRQGSLGSRGISLQKSTGHKAVPIVDFQVDANSVFDALKDANILLVLDEFDRLLCEATKRSLVELVKKLSDASSTSKVVVVGVAKTIDELIGIHPSAVRCFEQVEMRRMEKNEIQLILSNGFKEIGIGISSKLVEKVSCIADGYPHFAHLMGLNLVDASLIRLVRQDDKPIEVEEEDYLPAIRSAIEGSISSLKEGFARGIATPGIKTSIYRWILEGIAVQEHAETSIQDILSYINRLNPNKLFKSQAISSHLGKLVNKQKRGVLEKPRTGVYAFVDPMLRAYVRMQIAEYKLNKDLSYHQLTFDFV